MRRCMLIAFLSMVLTACGSAGGLPGYPPPLTGYVPPATPSPAVPTFSSLPVATVYVMPPSLRLGIVADENGRIVHVVPDGGAAQAGLVVGDQLVAPDNPARSEPSTWRSFVPVTVARDRPVVLYVERDGQIIEFQVQGTPMRPRGPAGTATPVLDPYVYF